MDDLFSATLGAEFDRMKIPYSAAAIRKMRAYFELLTAANRRLNLTRIVTEEEAAVKHFADSLSLLAAVDIPVGASLIDVGTGGGFPAVPLKILRDDLEVTAVDSTAKKLDFVRSACHNIGVDINAVCGRAEELGVDPRRREQYHVVVSRAVAPLNILRELCSPLMRPDGIFAAYKGSGGQSELVESSVAAKTLGLTLTDEYSPDIDGHCIFLFKKTQRTPTIYPREYRIIKRKPL